MKRVFNSRQVRRCVVGSVIIWAMLVVASDNFANGPLQPTGWKLPQQQVQEFTKTIKKEFPISPAATVDLSNKYGAIRVHTWDRQRVKIDVTIVVNARTESDANDVFDRIQIEFINDDDLVKATTTIESATSWWGTWNNKSEFEINYEVFMPGSCNLNLKNRYGDSSIDAISGNAGIEVKYGDFEMEGVEGDLRIYLGYGNATVVKARDVSAEISYSRINFSDAQDLSFDTRYSKIYIDRGASVSADSRYDLYSIGIIDRFKVDSRYGNVEIGEAGVIIADSRYTDYKVEKLKESADFDIEYGALKINHLADGFSRVLLNGKYSDFKIYVEPGAGFTLDGNSNYAAIAYPAELDVTFEKDRGTSHEVKGHTGTDVAHGVIKANLNYGGLRIRYKE